MNHVNIWANQNAQYAASTRQKPMHASWEAPAAYSRWNYRRTVIHSFISLGVQAAEVASPRYLSNFSLGLLLSDVVAHLPPSQAMPSHKNRSSSCTRSRTYYLAWQCKSLQHPCFESWCWVPLFVHKTRKASLFGLCAYSNIGVLLIFSSSAFSITAIHVTFYFQCTFGSYWR